VIRASVFIYTPHYELSTGSIEYWNYFHPSTDLVCVKHVWNFFTSRLRSILPRHLPFVTANIVSPYATVQ